MGRSTVLCPQQTLSGCTWTKNGPNSSKSLTCVFHFSYWRYERPTLHHQRCQKSLNLEIFLSIQSTFSWGRDEIASFSLWGFCFKQKYFSSVQIILTTTASGNSCFKSHQQNSIHETICELNSNTNLQWPRLHYSKCCLSRNNLKWKKGYKGKYT